MRCATTAPREYERAYCSGACLEAGVSFERSNNPNYSDAMEETTCEICGKPFEYYPSEKAGRYCPECVENENWQDPPKISNTALRSLIYTG